MQIGESHAAHRDVWSSHILKTSEENPPTTPEERPSPAESAGWTGGDCPADPAAAEVPQLCPVAARTGNVHPDSGKATFRREGDGRTSTSEGERDDCPHGACPEGGPSSFSDEGAHTRVRGLRRCQRGRQESGHTAEVPQWHSPVRTTHPQQPSTRVREAAKSPRASGVPERPLQNPHRACGNDYKQTKS